MGSWGGAAESGLDLSVVEVKVTDVSAEELARAEKGFLAFPIERLKNAALPVEVFLPRRNPAQGRLEMASLLAPERTLPRRIYDKLVGAGLDICYCRRSEVINLIQFNNQFLAGALHNYSLPVAEKARHIYDQGLLLVEHAMTDQRLGPNITMCQRYLKFLSSFISRDQAASRSLSEMLVLDYSLYTHSVNVCLLCTAFGHFLGLGTGQIQSLSLASLYHDLGKRDVPKDILLKDGPLSRDEWEWMRRHPLAGFEALKPLSKMPFESLNAVRQHHENLDGTGYPHGLRSHEIVMESRILRIVDAYDAITSRRSYKPAFEPAEGIRLMMTELKGKIASDLLTSFVVFLGEIGSCGELLGRGRVRRRRVLFNPPEPPPVSAADASPDPKGSG